MTSNDLFTFLPFAEPCTAKEVVEVIQRETFPGIDNQMKAPIYGPWLEYDFSPAFANSEAEIESELLCPNGEHDWEDDSYGGPDSGCMAAHCKRCGYGFHHQLY